LDCLLSLVRVTGGEKGDPVDIVLVALVERFKRLGVAVLEAEDEVVGGDAVLLWTGRLGDEESYTPDQVQAPDVE
jgi:hypothetical protein